MAISYYEIQWDTKASPQLSHFISILNNIILLYCKTSSRNLEVKIKKQEKKIKEKFLFLILQCTLVFAMN